MADNLCAYCGVRPKKNRSLWCSKSCAKKDWYARNTGHVKDRVSAWGRKNPNKVRTYKKRYDDKPINKRSHVLRRYNMTNGDYNRLLAEQDGRCAICGAMSEDRYLDVDHDHSTGEVRGLICYRCNRGLGFLRDSPELLESALAYLRKGVGIGR